MPKSENQKLKLLYLKKLLEERSDETHPVSVQAIIEYLAELGIRAERKSIYDDIDCLRSFGMDILQRKGQSGGYYLGAREFELPELKLLVDAVQCSKFLSSKKSVALIAKLETLTSQHAAGTLRRQVVVTGRVKSMNESIYYNVDRIHEAIARNSQLSFKYFEWGVDGERHYRPGVYTASPYALVWDDQNYYLVAHSPRHGITHYRVDKMSAIRQTGVARVSDDATRALDLSRYGKNVFSMFYGELITVKMRFHNSLAGVVIDRFGRASMLAPDGSEHFTFTTEIVVSPLYFGWIASFGAKASIVYPATVAAQYQALCRESLSQYE